MLFLEIRGSIIPYVRMTQRSKWVDPRAQAYLASKAAIQYQLKNQMVLENLDPLPDRTPLEVSLSFQRPAMHKCDLDNLLKAVLDACQGIVFKDDRWVDRIFTERSDATGEHFVSMVVRALT